MPWKNGGGETIEIAVHPPAAGLDDFDWRVSMAQVGTDGPFSVFDGIDRVLTLLDGAVMELSIECVGTHILTPCSPPLAFPADAATMARLPAGPIVDLNVMVRRGRFAAKVERFDRDVTLEACTGIAMILALGPLLVEAPDAVRELGHDDVLLCGPAPAEGTLRIAGESGGYHISIRPAGGDA